MKSVSGAQLAKVLEKHGWKLLRVKGSHHVYGKSEKIERISIPIHKNRPLKIGLLRHLLKAAGLEEKDL